VIGDVTGRTPVIVDDMISTGGTVEAAVKAAVRAGSHAEFIVAATHGVFTGSCAATLAALPLRRLLVTDSVSARPGGPEAERVSVAPLLAEAIARLHRGPAGER
jgi:ribose-phosphate pyrophosphokinase